MKDGHIAWDGDYDANGFLWFLDEGSSAYKIGNKVAGEGVWLASSSAYLDDIGNFISTGTASVSIEWGLKRNSLNATGLSVYNNNNSSQYWAHVRSGGYNYIHLQTLTQEDKDNYIWTFISFDDLIDEAKANGVSESVWAGLDGSKGTDFKKLVEAIATAKAAKVVGSYPDGDYVLLNRRHNLYLNAEGSSLKGTFTPTQFSVWTLTTTGGVKTLTNKGYDIAIRVENTWTSGTASNAGANFSLDNTKNAYNPAIIASSDGDRRFISLKYASTRNSSSVDVYFSLETPDGTVTSRQSQGFSSDWGLMSVDDYCEEHGIEAFPTSITSHADIVEDQFFHLINVARDYENYNEDTPGAYGWLTDVDHRHHALTLDAVYGGTDASCANAAAFRPDESQASALWQFILVGHGAESGENATGLLSPEHNVYLIRNANTGKYIGNPRSNSRGYIPLTADVDKAGRYFVSRLIDGQYSLCVYYGTDASGLDASNGYLSVLSPSAAHRASLCNSSSPTANTNNAWIISPAPTITVKLLTDTREGQEGSDGYMWSTFYYPFDVANGTEDGTDEYNGANTVKLFAGGWVSKEVSLEMLEAKEVPAGNAVIIRSDNCTEYKLRCWPAGSGHISVTDDAFGFNVWKGITESEDNSYMSQETAPYFGANWRNYWVLTKNSKGYARLLHPSGDYLLPNRAYLDAESVQSVKSFGFYFVIEDEQEITGMERLEANPIATDAATPVYDLQGRAVSGAPRSGVYIVGGKKVYIK
ncbi:MAG: hypothetical protein J6M53_02420 [Bacteroidaceae bacterium]|nr:hypothetical protein [Bacteroidaceae bacterium]